MKTKTAQLVSILGVALFMFQVVPPAGAGTVTWDGSTDMDWTQPDGTSWGGGTYNSGDTANFAGAGTGTVSVAAGGVTPGVMDVTSNGYTFTGGPIGGYLRADFTGTLQLTSSNAYSGASGILYSGIGSPTIAITASNALGSGAIRCNAYQDPVNRLTIRNASGSALVLPNYGFRGGPGNSALAVSGSDMTFTGLIDGGGGQGGYLSINGSSQSLTLANVAGVLSINIYSSDGSNNTLLLSGAVAAGTSVDMGGYWGNSMTLAVGTTIPAGVTISLGGQPGNGGSKLEARGADRTLGCSIGILANYGETTYFIGSHNLTATGTITFVGNNGKAYLDVTNGITVTTGDMFINGNPPVGSFIQKKGLGTLVINGTMTNRPGWACSPLTITAGTLAGNGTLTTNLTTIANGALLSPGTNLTAAGNLTMANGSTYVYETNDLIRVLGTLTLTDNWTNQLTGPGFKNGGQVTLFQYGSLAASPDLVPTYSFLNLGFTPDTLTMSNDAANSRILLLGIQVVLPSKGTVIVIR